MEHNGQVNQNRETALLLGSAFQLMISEFSARVAAAGYPDLRPMHGMAFQALRGGATASELATRLGVTKQAAGQLLDDLEQRGYVRRTAHPDGGRRRLAQLTERAEEHLATAGRILRQLEEETAERAGIDADRFRADLSRIVATLTAGAPAPPLRPVW